jgi:hypothetical protein
MKIQVLMAPGEAAREKALRKALGSDTRFAPLQIVAGRPVDLQFSVDVSCDEPYCGSGVVRKIFNVELKEPQDFVQSVLSGHLYDQTLSVREHAQDGCTVILGDLGDIQKAIKDSASDRHLRGADLSHAIATTHSRCKSFRKRSFLNGVPVFHKGDDSGFFDGEDQFADLLELAHDYLCDGSMCGFSLRPADGEREAQAASFLFPGMGAKSLAPVLQDYRLALVPRKAYARPVEEMPKIGPKRAKLLNSRIVMFYGAMV